MRTRLFVVLLVPLTCILLALGSAYAWSVSRSIQQSFMNQQLGDLNYFVTRASHALRAGNPNLIENDMMRYGELYSAEVFVLDRTGALWASGGVRPRVFDEDVDSQIALALSGRRSETTLPGVPWMMGDAVVVEPVFDDGSVIGVVMIAASAEGPRGQIATQWTWLAGVSVVVTSLLVIAVWRLSEWVLQPMRRVDEAMAAIEHGEMDARIDDDTGPPEMRQMIRVFNQMADEIERVVSRQQEFVLNASHELRNPLGALLMRVEYLATGLDDSWEADIEKAREEGQRMTRLLDTLLFMAKAEQKDSPFALVDLRDIVAGRLSAWQPVAQARRVTFDVTAPETVLALTDRTAVESALDAVLDNALKFAPAGSAIQVRVWRDGDSMISVRDWGPGVDTKELERITDRFWRSPRDQNVPGSGLGLAIATDLLESLGGAVRVAAADGGGLAVTLCLPGRETS